MTTGTDMSLFGPETAQIASEAIDGMLMTEELIILGASHLAASTLGHIPATMVGRDLIEVIEELEESNYPNSKNRHRTTMVARTAIRVATDAGLYTSVYWAVSPSGYVERVALHLHRCPIGYMMTILPLDDGFKPGVKNYDEATDTFQTLDGSEFTGEEIYIFEMLLTGLSATSIARNLEITEGSVRYKVRRILAAQNATTVAEVRDRIWQYMTEEAIIHDGAVIHCLSERFRSRIAEPK